MPDPNKLCIRYDSGSQTFTAHDFANPPNAYTQPYRIKENGHLHFEVDCGQYGVAIVGSDSVGAGAKDPDNPGVVFLSGQACSQSNGDPNVVQVRAKGETPNGTSIRILVFCVDQDGTRLLDDKNADQAGGPRMKVVA